MSDDLMCDMYETTRLALAAQCAEARLLRAALAALVASNVLPKCEAVECTLIATHREGSFYRNLIDPDDHVEQMCDAHAPLLSEPKENYWAPLMRQVEAALSGAGADGDAALEAGVAITMERDRARAHARRLRELFRSVEVARASGKETAMHSGYCGSTAEGYIVDWLCGETCFPCEFERELAAIDKEYGTTDG